ncbi:uncharacterized protein Dana_GF26566 [Drosophila ananassae]|uniref:Uncharacterized protein n=1 Tax=Drosophila ananassae TaxID=7217 RepID=A0A0P9ATC6_DROAN|nr:uncharacterized protein LOC26513975 [Drosophila ananassae]KPU80587.1 uncharacterized protein Dana_GF26566 [Drosophila ananassae]
MNLLSFLGFLVAVCASLCSAEKITAEILEKVVVGDIIEGCMIKKYGIKEQDARDVKTLPKERKRLVQMCLLHCMMEKGSFIINGKINPSKLRQSLGDNLTPAKMESVKKAEEQCHSMQYTKKCELGVQLLHCYQKTGNKIG